MTFTSPKTGEPVQRGWQIPHTHADLRARRLFSETWAEATFGLMGRAPDHVAGFFTGYAATPKFFASAGQQKFADNLVAFYEFMRDNHIYCSYAIVPPQIDRSKPAHQQSDPTLYAGVVKERDDGIVISGAQQLATGGAMSDYIHLSCIQPLPAGRRELRQLPRRPGRRRRRQTLSAQAVRAAPAARPIIRCRAGSTKPTAMSIFDNVFVPWERVFIYRNVELSRDQWRKTPSHLHGNHQAQTRYVTKLRFMAGLAQRMNETTGNAANPAVVGLMGELCALVSIYEAMLHAHETMATIEDGVLWPSRTAYYAASAMQSEFNGRMLEIIREMAGAAFITLPSSDADFDNPEIAADLERYMRSGTSDAKTRIKLMRLIWDFLGSEFGSRHAQYEKFYGGPSFVAKQNSLSHFRFQAGWCAGGSGAEFAGGGGIKIQ